MCTVVKKAKAQSKQSKQGRDYHVGCRQEDRQEKTRKQILEGASVTRHRKGYFTNNNIEAPTAGRTNSFIDFLFSS